MVIVLDTNVFREGVHPKGDPKVKEWLRQLPLEESTTTIINVAEMRAGTARMPYGRDRIHLETFIERQIVEGYGDRLLPFDLTAAAVYAADVAERERRGRQVGALDVMIGAICKVHGTAIATRNVKDFEGIGLQIVNPWEL
ncbi:type II toxin-antitoxin system VapC family toxin [Glycomyces sp. NPDC047010]|uniref:type II toxin-antitoxin system VapC family toxin n=1 Tax=Glycomyces sp. NPDC047010 TaxID=3155023 RepID=UPI0033D763E6